MFRSVQVHPTNEPRRGDARASLAALLMLLFTAVALPAAGPRPEPTVSVSEHSGVFRVSATFTIAQPSAYALATLTDYPSIPRFMPEVRTSNVLELVNNRAVVEQEAVARFAVFSKRVHLVLEIDQEPEALRFRDRCGTSFTRYEGLWSFVERDGRTYITYELSAKPAFDVPGFMLKRLLKRDAVHMIERLSTEIDARAQ